MVTCKIQVIKHSRQFLKVIYPRVFLWWILQLLKNLVERRRMVKSWLKTASGLKAQQFDIQQQALKLTANRSHCFCYTHTPTLYILVLLDASSSLSYYWRYFSWGDKILLQYVWVSRILQFKILCKVASRAYNLTSRKLTFPELLYISFKQITTACLTSLFCFVGKGNFTEYCWPSSHFTKPGGFLLVEFVVYLSFLNVKFGPWTHCYLINQVIYGDTDSIMIYSGLDDIGKSKAIAAKVIQEVGVDCTLFFPELDSVHRVTS